MTPPVPSTTGTADTCDLSDGDLLIVRFDYLRVGRTVRMRSVRSDALIRIFITVPQREEGFLDYSKLRWRSCRTVVVSRDG
jgi:hypothetical protein